MKLSEQVRPDVEAAPWVIEKIKALESELEVSQAFYRLAISERNAAYAELRKLSGKVPGVYDRVVWARAKAQLPHHENEPMNPIQKYTEGPHEFFYVEVTIHGEKRFVCSFSDDFEDYWIVDDLESDTSILIEDYVFSLEEALSTRP